MQTYLSIAPLITILIPVIASLLIIISWRFPNIRETWTVLASFGMCASVLIMLPDVLSGQYPQTVLLSISPGISLALKADTVGIIFALSASFLWIATSIFSIGYMRGLQEKKQTRYYACFAIALASTMGVAFAANLLTFLIFFELLTIATYPLIIHKETAEAISAGRKYLAYLLTGGLSLILAIGITFQLTGVVDFHAGGFFSKEMDKSWLMALFALFTVGFGMKSAIIPLHSWLPVAMIAPTPVSALLHAVAVVKAGVFGFVRLVGFVFGPGLFHEIGAGAILASLAGVTIVISSLLAMYNDNLKRRLAYSTIGHLSYIILGVSLLSPLSWTGGLLHIVNHAMLKITLFFCAGAIYVHNHLEKVSELDGIGKKMPVTMVAFTLASIGLVGLPPMSGFISKWYLTSGSISSETIVFLGVFLLSGLLNAGYLFPIVRRAFFCKSVNTPIKGEGSPWLLVPIVIIVLISLLLCLLPNGIFHFYDLVNQAVSKIMSGAK